MKTVFLCFALLAVASAAVISTQDLTLSSRRTITVPALIYKLKELIETKKRNIIDDTESIQTLIDSVVAAIVNGTPLPPEITDTSDPTSFIFNIIDVVINKLTGSGSA